MALLNLSLITDEFSFALAITEVGMCLSKKLDIGFLCFHWEEFLLAAGLG